MNIFFQICLSALAMCIGILLLPKIKAGQKKAVNNKSKRLIYLMLFLIVVFGGIYIVLFIPLWMNLNLIYIHPFIVLTLLFICKYYYLSKANLKLNNNYDAYLYHFLFMTMLVPFLITYQATYSSDANSMNVVLTKISMLNKDVFLLEQFSVRGYYLIFTLSIFMIYPIIMLLIEITTLKLTNTNGSFLLMMKPKNFYLLHLIIFIIIVAIPPYMLFK